MKKTLTALMLCFVSIISYSQIQPIQTQKPRFEFLGPHVCYDTEIGDFDMMIKSDNQFEDTRAHISLGKSPEQAIESLKNLKDAIMTEKAEFTLEGYSFYVVAKGRAAILGLGKLEHTAGSYYVTDAGINSDIFAIVEKFNLGYGEFEVSIYSVSSFAMLYIYFPQYGNRELITLNTNDYKKKMSDYISGEKGTVLTESQVQLLIEKIKDGTIRENNDTRLFIKVVEGK